MSSPYLIHNNSSPELELPRPPGAVRRFLGRHPRFVDLCAPTLYLALFGTMATYRLVAHPSGAATIFFGGVLVAGVALLFRRHTPVTTFVITLIVLVSSNFGEHGSNFVPVVLALYSLALYSSTRGAWGAYGLTCITVIAMGLSDTSLSPSPRSLTETSVDIPVPVGMVIFLGLLAVLAGNTVGARRRYLDALIERATQLAHERDQQAEIATTAERNRIAREMHDIVSHSLTVMITLTEGSARLTHSDPERAAETARTAAEVGRMALADMRLSLGVLRDDDHDAEQSAPQPGLSDIAELIEGFRTAGIPVRVTMTGVPSEDAGQQLTVFRIVQEGLTNILRYASSATTVTVAIGFSDEISVTIEDDSSVHPPGVSGSGRGLLGLRERVALYGGTLTAGPRIPDGWRLSAVFSAVTTPAAPPGEF